MALRFSRRSFAASALAAAAGFPLLARGQVTPLDYALRTAADRGLMLAPTPACGTLSWPQTEGPFYSPRTPERASLLEPGAGATRLVVQGLVLTRDCRTVAGAVIDFWHCDENGAYDNAGTRYRGHQFTDAAGAFRLETIRPAEYPGRTPHIHAKLQGPGTAMLTTQLYFPDEAVANAEDPIFSPALLIAQQSEPDGSILGRFDFVVLGG